MRNVCEISIKNLIYNAKQIKKLLPKGVKFNAVVKADAYGHGLEKVASALYPFVDSYSVALVEEAISLRNSGIDKEILVLIPLDKSEIDRAIEYNLTVTVTELRQAKDVNEIAKKRNAVCRVHVKVDTGINRLGFSDLDKLEKAVKFLSGKKNVKLCGLFSHYACPEDEKSLKSATDKFLLAIERVKRYNNKVICHASASGGFLKGKFFDMVRIGILLYGYKPFESNLINVKPVMKIYARVLKRRSLDKGQSALYGVNPIEQATDITLIRYGYADGLERKKVGEQINNRCMDITAVRGALRKKICILKDASLLAKEYQTITYEILTKSAIRAEKIYVY